MRKLIVCGAALAFALPSMAGEVRAQKVQNLGWNGKVVKAQRAARLDLSTGRFGPIMQLGGASDACPATTLHFDCYEMDDTTTLNPSGGDDCGGLPDSRLYFGPAYVNPWVVEDMTVESALAGKETERVAIGAFFPGNGDGVPTNLVILVLMNDDFDANCGGLPAINNDAIALDFGAVPGENGGYYIFDGDICGVDSWTLPSSGSGGHELLFLSYSNPQSPFTTLQYPGLAAPSWLNAIGVVPPLNGASEGFAQVMYWGTKDVDPDPEPLRTGTQVSQSYNDDADPKNVNSCLGDQFLPDGILDECAAPLPECYDNTYVCPSALGAMVAFLGEPTGCKWDLNGDGKVCQEDLGQLLAGYGTLYSQGDLGELLSQYNGGCGAPCTP